MSATQLSGTKRLVHWCQGTEISKISTRPYYRRVWLKTRKNALQISEFQLVLYQKPLVRGIEQGELSCPACWILFISYCIMLQKQYTTLMAFGFKTVQIIDNNNYQNSCYIVKCKSNSYYHIGKKGTWIQFNARWMLKGPEC